LVLLAAACGNGGGMNNGGKKDAADIPMVDTPPPIDAPPLLGCTPVNGTTVRVRQVGRVSGGAMLATSPPNDGRLFVVEQGGRIRIFENEMLKTTPFLDVTAIPNFVAGGESGLLGLAFHPNYGNNRQFYVFYTTGGCPGTNCANVVAKYTQSATDPNVADPTGEVLLTIPDFASNHNGGMIEFGSDGFLYIGTGDGGGGGDPQRTAQNANNLLGKILRIDVNNPAGGKPYGIPADNPFATTGGAPEVFILGLRNPWRWSFDRANGDMWIGDVGQGTDEEVHVLKAPITPGTNLGWSKFEGDRCYGNYMPCTNGDHVGNNMAGPQVIRPQSQGWRAIIGGQVYRGACFPDLAGTYFFTDNTLRPLQTGKLDPNGTVTTVNLPPPANPGTWPGGPAGIHADARGELYLTTTGGFVYQIEAGP
jgi:glucose/arabinose dehydrogenase